MGEQWSLFSGSNGWSAGGWVQTGYHSSALPIFNDRPDEFNLHQAWLYAEKAIDTRGGFDIGGRIDYVYGIDAQNTQAFGTEVGRGPRTDWDNDWDHGAYGNALPQAYLEAGYGDLSVKMGHFYTIIGYEVVQATGNFFYSHAYTFNNSEPFTHTGLLATYNVNDNVTAYGGYTMGWDSGFEDNGDNYLGGLSLGLSDNVNLTYASAVGTFNTGGGLKENGYMHSIVADIALSDSLQWVFQSDLLDTELQGGGASAPLRETFGINNYLIKTINDCWAVGGRFEWWNAEAGGTGDSDVYALTLGVNHKPNANMIIRPEIRWDWDDDNIVGLEDNDDDQFTFGVDSIFLF